jgi:putative thioredoxin
MLEKLEAEAGGTWQLAKVNVDEDQQLAAHFGVRSIPHVVAFVDGQAVDQFVGVLPESGLRDFLARLSPGQAPDPLQDALELAAAGHREAAEAAFLAAIDQAEGANTDADTNADTNADAARLPYIGFLLDGDAVAQAEAEFGKLSPQAAQSGGYAALQTRLEALRGLSGLADEGSLLARIETDPKDVAARLDLAKRWIALGNYEAALGQLLAIVRTNRAFGEDIGRKTMLSVFDLLAGQPDVVSRWRRQLSQALN